VTALTRGAVMMIASCCLFVFLAAAAAAAVGLFLTPPLRIMVGALSFSGGVRRRFPRRAGGIELRRFGGENFFDLVLIPYLFSFSTVPLFLLWEDFPVSFFFLSPCVVFSLV
jgi:hypothetical protein